jgi:hypothetical protein
MHFTRYIRSIPHNYGEGCAGWWRQAASYLLRCTTALQTSAVGGGRRWASCCCTRDRDDPHATGSDWPCPGHGVLSRRRRAAPGGGSGVMADRRGFVATGTVATLLGLAVDRAGAVLRGGPFLSEPEKWAPDPQQPGLLPTSPLRSAPWASAGPGGGQSVVFAWPALLASGWTVTMVLAFGDGLAWSCPVPPAVLASAGFVTAGGFAFIDGAAWS